MEFFFRIRFLVVVICTSMYFRTRSAATTAVTTINCATDVNCSSVENAVCDSSISHKCTCKGAFKVNSTVCSLKVLGDACVNTTDCRRVTNAVCGASNTCVCSESFKTTGNACTKKGLNDTCKRDGDCTHVSHATCDGNTNKCNCTGDYKVNSTICSQKASSAVNVGWTINMIVVSLLLVVLGRSYINL